MNHAVVIVGRGFDAASKRDYWLVRNSWGTGWGEKGYIKIAITKIGFGTCGEAIQGWNIAMKAF